MISETFVSRQGEGLLTGTPSLFIRTSGCNLRCWFCDTPYASWNPSGDSRTLDSLIAEATRSTVDGQPIEHVVLTGGEPLVMKGIDRLIGRLQELGLHVTIETAGTVGCQTPANLLSLSPKLSASTPDKKVHPAWARRHEDRRMPIDTMRALIDQAEQHQVKFVVDSSGEFDEINHVVDSLGVLPENVWIMPQGTTIEQLDAAAPWLRPWSEASGYRFCDRMQIRWYGNRRGT